MYHIDELISLVKHAATRLLFIETASTSAVGELARRLSTETILPEAVPIYVIDGEPDGTYSWTFGKFKTPPILQLTGKGERVVSRGRLVVPQDQPIILLIEQFELLSPEDQRAFAHLADGEGGEYALAKGSLVIAVVSRGGMGRVESGSLNRGMVFGLDRA